MRYLYSAEYQILLQHKIGTTKQGNRALHKNSGRSRTYTELEPTATRHRVGTLDQISKR